MDDPEPSRRLVADLVLPFRVLSDAERSVIELYGLAHAGGGLEGETIAVPAQILVRSDGSIAWSFVASRINARTPPESTLHALQRL